MKRAALTYRVEQKIAPYADALRSVGIDPVLASPEAPLDSLNGMGLVLSGGTDLDPALYGAVAQPGNDDPDRERDALEQKLLREALERDLPVLAICRGMQLFNVAHAGGTLLQHIEGHRLVTHEISIEPGTRLSKIFGAGARPVNSRHHQAVAVLGGGLVISARAADGVIEGLERADRRFAVAVQWHPEDLLEERALFEAFGESL